MANEVFISYSRADYQKVRKIKETIDREVGIDCWMDLDGIESDQQFVDVIINAINRHDTMLFMMSKKSMQSKWALRELSFAESKQKRIVLVRLDNAVMPDKFAFYYQNKDQIEWGNKQQRTKLIKNIKSWFQIEDGNNPASPDTQSTRPHQPTPPPTPSQPTEKELGKWNWGAFFLSWIWGLGNGVYWPLVIIVCILLPYVGWMASIIICIELGSKGTKWAWKAKNWDSWNSFEETQHKWAVATWWFIGFVFVIGIIVGLSS